jgi:hypothetical protein
MVQTHRGTARMVAAALATAMIWSGGTALAQDDTTPPTIQIGSPVDGSVQWPGNWVAASYACSDVGGSGLTRCEGTVADGEPIDTSFGAHRLEVVAEDGAGNVATASVGYVVFDSLAGSVLESTAHRPGAGLTLELGMHLPRKAAGLAGATAQAVNCFNTDVVEGEPLEAAVRERVANSGALILRWNTDRAWEGTCRQLTLRFAASEWEDATARFSVSFA